VPLRPLGLGEILDGAFTCIRLYPRATLGLSAIVVAVTQAIQLPLTWLLLRDAAALDTEGLETGTVDNDEVIKFVVEASAVALVSLAITFLALLVLTGMLTAIIGKAVLGQPAPIGEAWATIRPQLGRLVGLSLLTGLLVVLAFAAGLVPGVLLAVAGGAPAGAVTLLVIGGLLGFVAAVYLYVTLSLGTPALVLEKQRVGAALRRSRELVRGAWWRIFGILLLSTIIAQVIGGIIALPFELAGSGTSLFDPNAGAPSFVGLLLSAIGGVVGGTVTQPFTAGVVALLYVDRRIRREALDVALLAASSAQR
jgi:hypothetical protein